AAKRSSRFGRRTWLLATLSFALYTIGQAVFTYTHAFSPPRSALMYDPIFFFWIVPLVAAALAEPSEIAPGFQWSSVLDFSLLVLLALAVHLFAFGNAWHSHASSEEMLFWRFKARLVRDVIVLAGLWGRVLLTDFRQIRALFLRLGVIYSTYAVANAA